MNERSLKSVVARNTEIVTADMDGETVMMNIETGKYYSLGKTGSAIWGIVEFPIAVGALIERLLEQYDVGREQCEKDVFAFLNETSKEGLFVIG